MVQLVGLVGQLPSERSRRFGEFVREPQVIQYPMFWSDPTVISPTGSSAMPTPRYLVGVGPVSFGLIGFAAAAGIVGGYLVSRHRLPRKPAEKL